MNLRVQNKRWVMLCRACMGLGGRLPASRSGIADAAMVRTRVENQQSYETNRALFTRTMRAVFVKMIDFKIRGSKGSGVVPRYIKRMLNHQYGQTRSAVIRQHDHQQQNTTIKTSAQGSTPTQTTKSNKKDINNTKTPSMSLPKAEITMGDESREKPLR